MKRKKIILWGLQLICAGILFFTAWSKLSGQAESIHIFSELGMEPTGRYLIGVIELCAALFLLSDRAAGIGGLLAVGTMCGALLAHLSVLGFDLDHVIMLSIVITSSTIVTIVRRRQLPLIGSTFRE